MIIKYNYPLISLNTLGIDVRADRYIKVPDLNETKELLKSGDVDPAKCLILGGGSNILFTGDYNGTIIQPAFAGISIEKTGMHKVTVSAGAGLAWDSFVEWCVRRDLGGLENLSYIPGNVGAAPIQNIGAYGVESGDMINKVHALSLEDASPLTYSREQCLFAYRDSIFKSALKGKVMITRVEFELRKSPTRFNLSYGNLEKTVTGMGAVTLSNVRNAVIRTRRKKLPDPEVTGNAGSFFKNPLIGKDLYKGLKSEFADMPSWETGGEGYKIPAAWLIEKAGWKGKRFGCAGVHANHALILVNLGHAEGVEILELSNRIIDSVSEMFGISLEREVNIV